MFGILASIIDGVLVGLVYGLAAMGLTLIWGVMDVINQSRYPSLRGLNPFHARISGLHLWADYMSPGLMGDVHNLVVLLWRY